jgi:hypothetical protein
MARELARPAHPRGAAPDTWQRESELVDTSTYTRRAADFVHTAGDFCTQCTPIPCKCGGWVHHIYSEGSRWCGKCGRLS